VKYIELWLVEKLISYARNPRTQSDAQIAASIAEFGFNYLATSCTASFSFSAQKDSSKSLSGIRCCLIRTLNGRV